MDDEGELDGDDAEEDGAKDEPPEAVEGNEEGDTGGEEKACDDEVDREGTGAGL